MHMSITELIRMLQEELTTHGNLPVYLATPEGEFEPEVEVTAKIRTIKNGYQTIAFPARKRLLLGKKNGESLF